jgi:hypothetical protein
MKTTYLAKLTSLTVRRINQLVAEKILPATDNGSFSDDGAALSAMFEHFKSQKQSGWRLRYEAARGEREELKLKAEKRLLVPVVDVERIGANVIVQLREVILRIPHNVGSQIGDMKAQTIAEKICADALRECAKGLHKLADDEEARDDKETPGE